MIRLQADGNQVFGAFIKTNTERREEIWHGTKDEGSRKQFIGAGRNNIYERANMKLPDKFPSHNTYALDVYA